MNYSDALDVYSDPVERRKIRNRIAQRNRRMFQYSWGYLDTDPTVGQRLKGHIKSIESPQETLTEQRRTVEQESSCSALAQRVDDYTSQTSLNKLSSSSWDSAANMEYTSPFEAGYALLKGTARDVPCPKAQATATGTQTDEGSTWKSGWKLSRFRVSLSLLRSSLLPSWQTSFTFKR